MASVNKVILIGNLTRDPEVRYIPNGTAVADIGLAVNRRYTADGGEKREEVTFIDVTLWGRTAELASQYLTKGRPVYIEGRLQMDSWEDKQSGQKRSKLKVVGETMQFLGSGGSGGSGGNQQSGPPAAVDPMQNQNTAPQQQPQQQAAPAPKQPTGGTAYEPNLDEGDDIPF